MGRPHQTLREQHLSPPCETNLFEVKGLSGQTQVHAVASGWSRWTGEMLRLRTSVFQTKANSVFQQSEANLALGSQG